MTLDPADPTVWWRMFVDAVIGYKARNTDAALAYCRFVEEHRGRQVATAARDSIRRCSKSSAFEAVAEWPAWGYASKPPRVHSDAVPARKKKR